MLTGEEAVRVMESVSPKTSQGLRDRAMLEVLYSTGMRKGELVALNVADFSFERRELVILKSKSSKDRVVSVGEYARHFAEAYLKELRPWLARSDDEKALFVNVRGGRLAARTVGQIVGRAAKRSGVARKITPHTFRHSMSIHMLRNQADFRHIQEILGHARITSTELCIHISLEDLTNVVRRAYPHGRKER